ncbi:MAG: hypothetical protein FWC91_00050 [Defluviitaleaceae bacterium]|nr:hypothetical protein [Defluviitaleaceae bacterium]
MSIESVLISLLIGIAISVVIMLVKRSSLKSVDFEQTACNYVRDGSFRVTQSDDTFLYSNVSRAQRQQNNTQSSNTGRGSSTRRTGRGSR